MNKQTRSLIILGATLVVLLALWLGSTMIPGLKPSETTIAESSAAASLYTADAATVKQIFRSQ